MSHNDNTARITAKITPATRILQAFFGRGKVKKENIEKAEKKMDVVRGRIDISEFVDEHLKGIEAALSNIEAGKNHESILDDIARSMAKFKSNAGTFSDGNFVDLSSIMLRWVESVEKIDKDVLDVLNGYYATMKKICLENAFTPAQVDIITKEMSDACERYFAKHPELQLTREISNSNAFYINDTDLDAAIASKFDSELLDEKLIASEKDIEDLEKKQE